MVQWATTNNTNEQYKSTNNIPMGNNTKIQYQYNGNTIPIIHNNINEWATLYQWVYQHDNKYNTDKSITNIIPILHKQYQ